MGLPLDEVVLDQLFVLVKVRLASVAILDDEELRNMVIQLSARS
jgi:hypothetical protein